MWYITLRRTKGEIRQNYYLFANLKENISDDRIRQSMLCSIGQFSDKLYAGATNENGVEFIELPEF